MYTIHLGEPGFPFGNATIQRIRLTFKALTNAGIKTLILNKFSYHKNYIQKRVNRFEGTPYINLSNSPNRPDSFVLRIFNKFTGLFNEFIFLFNKRKYIDSAILYTASFSSLFYYRLLSIIFDFRLIIQYVEFRSAITSRQKLFYRLNDYLFDNHFHRFCDGVI